MGGAWDRGAVGDADVTRGDSSRSGGGGSLSGLPLLPSDDSRLGGRGAQGSLPSRVSVESQHWRWQMEAFAEEGGAGGMPGRGERLPGSLMQMKTIRMLSSWIETGCSTG
eukprot:Cvel_6733.t1-p1 / transcript=Cvel_6733.t1 / gene=Cvel_6733 / organism=Chromera_velia_CCMP2878 / gene_product=hypothetical protein / transcript_product=hypothetical protein / location=Cvel_scaffold337:2725-3052(-) / protein_length=109 / sequence_SO=supercontig / SO=protein_coding / is_pseudo=false